MKIRIDTAGFRRDMEAFAAALEESTVAAVTDAVSYTHLARATRR